MGNLALLSRFRIGGGIRHKLSLQSAVLSHIDSIIYYPGLAAGLRYTYTRKCPTGSEKVEMLMFCVVDCRNGRKSGKEKKRKFGNRKEEQEKSKDERKNIEEKS